MQSFKVGAEKRGETVEWLSVEDGKCSDAFSPPGMISIAGSTDRFHRGYLRWSSFPVPPEERDIRSAVLFRFQLCAPIGNDSRLPLLSS